MDGILFELNDGTISTEALLTVIMTGWVIKPLVSLTATPITHAIKQQ